MNSNVGLASSEVTIRYKERERQALLTFKHGRIFYQQPQGIPIFGHESWLCSWGNEDGKKECGKWEGVRCSNKTSHVVALNLHLDREQYIRLGGKILSPLLIELHHLKYLGLSHNYFDGLVSYLGNPSRLQYLDLINIDTHNYGFGGIKWLSCLSNLEYLDLSHNQIQEIDLKVHSLFPSTSSRSSLSHINASSTSLTAIYLRNNFLTF